MLKIAKFFPLFLLAAILLPAHAQQLPGRHPAYLHALTDLRTARWLLSHQPGDRKVFEEEDMALDEVNAAIGEIKHASIDDGKNIDDHMPVDAKEHGSRLLRAIEALNKAKADIEQSEDNPEVRELRHRAKDHIDRAIHAAEKAHDRWLKDMGK